MARRCNDKRDPAAIAPVRDRACRDTEVAGDLAGRIVHLGLVERELLFKGSIFEGHGNLHLLWAFFGSYGSFRIFIISAYHQTAKSQF
jgi:hypothetical protein